MPEELTIRARKDGKTCQQRWQDPTAPAYRSDVPSLMSEWILPSSFDPALDLHRLSIHHSLFQIVIIYVCNGGKNCLRARLWLGLGKEDGNRRTKKLGQS